ncbi:MAG: class I SAM-dependent methyltransferase [Candidatus Doudnabacteria bacterium]|nr:class I SAM-dependent methyltransferase [Candidatus Doudnabacteria bacterium]
MVNSNTSWGKVAGWYNQLLEEGEDTYQEKVIKPNLLRLLNISPGENIIDIGCGQGYFSRELAKAGAKVLGVDIGAELISLAKTQSGKNESYLVLSAEKLNGIADNRFDAAICILALQNMKNLPAAIGEMSRVLKPGGRAVLVLNHPTFRVPGASNWDYDEKQKVQYRRIDGYMSEITQAVDMTQGVKEMRNKKFTYSFHHPLQVYFKAFYKSGLVVSRLEEWISHKTSDKGARKLAEDKARKEIPLFMCIEVRKTADTRMQAG